MSTIIRDNTDDSRFEIEVDGQLAGYVDYRAHNGEYALPHTRVLPEFGGRGVGGQLIVGALEEISRRGGTVLPFCPFVPKVLLDNPQFIELVPADRREEFGL